MKDLIFNQFRKFQSDFKQKLCEFLKDNIKQYSVKKREIYKQHDIENKEKFSFFELISDLYYREKFHSDILFSILNGKTPDIGQDFYLEYFVDYLGIPKDVFNPKIPYTIELEHSTGKIFKSQIDTDGKKGFIDILIYNSTQAIIIENKINYAPDMENQIVRYMKYVEEEMGIKKYAVVYLTLTDDSNKKIPITSYSNEYSYYTDKLKNNNGKIFFECYATGHNSLSNVFLKKCINKLSKLNIKTAEVFLEQYRILLDHEGGDAYMENLESSIIEKIIFDDEKVKIAEDFFELWTNVKNGKLNHDLIKRYVKEKTGLNFSFGNIHSYDGYFYKKENFYIYWNANFEIGFSSLEGKDFKSETQNILKKKLDSISNLVKTDKNAQWVWGTVTNKDNSNILKNLVGIINELDKA